MHSGSDKRAREADLEKLDNDRLIEVVRNYRQYGYDENIRNDALKILRHRGISREMLQLTGNFENYCYTQANQLSIAFCRNSRIALIFYLMVILLGILTSLYPMAEQTREMAINLNYGFMALFIIFLVKSFVNQVQCFGAMGQNYSTERVLVFFIIGIPLYFLMYFFFRKQMLEKISEIR